MVVSGTDIKYKEFKEKGRVYWTFGNEVLYQMCRDNPLHIDGEVIVGKLLLIGRTYAAALERRKNAEGSSDVFYYDLVAPKMIGVGTNLDEQIALLNKYDGDIKNNAAIVIDTHAFLVRTFDKGLTGLNKRSLASKYLHFHCPNMFYIYDSRADKAVRKLVKKPDKRVLESIEDYDTVYGEFVCRMIELQTYLEEAFGHTVSPRELDDFLLWTIE